MLNQRLTFLCSLEDRQIIQMLSQFYHRSMGDTIRQLIREAYSECLESIEVNNPRRKQKKPFTLEVEE
jgi:hypothetical protein